MAGTVQYTNLQSRSARARLKRGRQPHWEALHPGKVHLGWQCWKGEPTGHWILRRYVGFTKSKTGKKVARYRTETLGAADDSAVADSENVLSYVQAKAGAEAKVATPKSGKVEPLTVRDAITLYIDYKRDAGLDEPAIKDLISRSETRILPELGDLVVSELETAELRRWLATMAASPAQTRPKDGKPQFRAGPVGADEVRSRRASANRVLTLLKAALNYAFDEGKVSNRDAWGRRLKPFENVEVARTRFLKLDEARRLLNSCDADFRPLVRAALETGCRYGELTRLEVEDFNSNAGTLMIRQSKSGQPRSVTLTEAGRTFFKEHCAGRRGVMFLHHGKPWLKSEQARPMREACKHAGIKPAVGFHQLRHTWASLAVMNDMPLMVVAKNLGHVDTRMVEKHYGHLAPSFVTELIRSKAPVYDVTERNKVVALGEATPRTGSASRRQSRRPA